MPGQDGTADAEAQPYRGIGYDEGVKGVLPRPAERRRDSTAAATTSSNDEYTKRGGQRPEPIGRQRSALS